MGFRNKKNKKGKKKLHERFAFRAPYRTKKKSEINEFFSLPPTQISRINIK
jgi:hypothetical protein